jgi:hypothetical protein
MAELRPRAEPNGGSTMRTEIVIACLSTALNLAMWGAFYLRLRGLPLDVWKVAQRDRAGDEKRALDVLQEAAASRIGGLVIAIKTYHDQLACLVRAQLAEAEVRARVSERRSSEASIALDAASVLVRDLRTLAEDLPSRFDRRAMRVGIAIGESAVRRDERAPANAERTTVEMPSDVMTLAGADGQDGAA